MLIKGSVKEKAGTLIVYNSKSSKSNSQNKKNRQIITLRCLVLSLRVAIRAAVALSLAVTIYSGQLPSWSSSKAVSSKIEQVLSCWGSNRRVLHWHVCPLLIKIGDALLPIHSGNELGLDLLLLKFLPVDTLEPLMLLYILTAIGAISNSLLRLFLQQLYIQKKVLVSGLAGRYTN